MERIQRLKFVLSAIFSLFCILFASISKLVFYSYLRYRGHSDLYLIVSAAIIVIAYPSLAHLSDVWSRKKMLFISLSTMIISLILLYFNYIILSTVFISLSPVVSIGRAAFCDTHMTNNRGPNILDTFIVQSFAWILAPVLPFSSHSFIFSTILFGLALVLMCLFFEDIRNRHLLNKKFGWLEAVNTYGINICLIIPISFFLSNMSWSILFYKKTTFTEKGFFSLAGIAFFLGIFLMRLIVRRRKIFFSGAFRQKNVLRRDRQLY